jgi:hypothetical protein
LEVRGTLHGSPCKNVATFLGLRRDLAMTDVPEAFTPTILP